MLPPETCALRFLKITSLIRNKYLHIPEGSTEFIFGKSPVMVGGIGSQVPEKNRKMTDRIVI
jgi:hypothetical protein